MPKCLELVWTRPSSNRETNRPSINGQKISARVAPAAQIGYTDNATSIRNNANRVGTRTKGVNEPAFQTAQMRACLERIHAGDRAAREELLRAVGARMERLARKMLGKYPRVQRWADTGDVLQGALLRLLRSLEHVPVATTYEFFGLAAEQVRRELLDLARHYYGPRGLGANYASTGGAAQKLEVIDPAEDPAELERWCRLHEAVAELPEAEREIFGLMFYHGWPTAQVAELCEVSERTVRRRWRSACEQLQRLVGGELPRP